MPETNNDSLAYRLQGLAEAMVYDRDCRRWLASLPEKPWIDAVLIMGQHEDFKTAVVGRHGFYDAGIPWTEVRRLRGYSGLLEFTEDALFEILWASKNAVSSLCEDKS